MARKPFPKKTFIARPLAQSKYFLSDTAADQVERHIHVYLFRGTSLRFWDDDEALKYIAGNCDVVLPELKA